MKAILYHNIAIYNGVNEVSKKKKKKEMKCQWQDPQRWSQLKNLKKILDGLPCNLVQTFVLSFWESVQNVALC